MRDGRYLRRFAHMDCAEGAVVPSDVQTVKPCVHDFITAMQVAVGLRLPISKIHPIGAKSVVC